MAHKASQKIGELLSPDNPGLLKENIRLSNEHHAGDPALAVKLEAVQGAIAKVCRVFSSMLWLFNTVDMLLDHKQVHG